MAQSLFIAQLYIPVAHPVGPGVQSILADF